MVHSNFCPINQVTILTAEACARAETTSKLMAEVYVGESRKVERLSQWASDTHAGGRGVQKRMAGAVRQAGMGLRWDVEEVVHKGKLN